MQTSNTRILCCSEIHILIKNRLKTFTCLPIEAHISKNRCLLNDGGDFVWSIMSCILPPLKRIHVQTKFIGKQSSSTHPHSQIIRLECDHLLCCRKRGCCLFQCRLLPQSRKTRIGDDSPRISMFWIQFDRFSSVLKCLFSLISFQCFQSIKIVCFCSHAFTSIISIFALIATWTNWLWSSIVCMSGTLSSCFSIALIWTIIVPIWTTSS